MKQYNDGPKPQRGYQRIVREILHLIVSGDLQPGDRLESTRELAERFGCGRPVINEALLALEILGYVEIWKSSGVYVANSPNGANASAPTSLLIDDPGPWELIEARCLVEGQAAYLAAQRVGPEQVQELIELVKELEANIENIPRFDLLERTFHRLIAAWSGNSLFASYVEFLLGLKDSPFSQNWYEKTRDIANRRRSLEDYRMIIFALDNHQPEVARDAMRAHINLLTRRITDAIPEGS